jgi:hypothetical protein
MTRNGMHDSASAGEGSGEAIANIGRNQRYPFLAARQTTYARLELFSF